MTGKTVVVPMVRKKKHHNKAPFSVSLKVTQFALEVAAKDISALKKQCDGLARLDKEKDIRLNRQDREINRLWERVERRDSE